MNQGDTDLSDQKQLDVALSRPQNMPDTFHGTLNSGRHKLLINGVKMLGRGQLFTFHTSNKWLVVPHIGVMSNLSEVKIELIVMLDCIDHKTRESKRFIGLLEPNHSPANPQKTIPATCKIPPAISLLRDIPLQVGNSCSLDPKRETQKQAKHEIDVSNELASAMKSLEQGVDPTLKMPFIKVHLDLSHSTIYRELKRGRFPPPIKHGKAVTWLFSQIEAYRLGNWVPA